MEEVPKFSLELDLRGIDACQEFRQRPCNDALNFAQASDQLLSLELTELRMRGVLLKRNSVAQALAANATTVQLCLAESFALARTTVWAYTATQNLRIREAKEGRARTPVIALSTATDAHHLSQCFSFGMDGVLRKPVRIGELRALLDLWTGRPVVESAFNSPPDFFSAGSLADRHRRSIIEDLSSLKAAAIGGDWEECRRLAHRLREAALMGGYGEIADWAADIDTGSPDWLSAA